MTAFREPVPVMEENEEKVKKTLAWRLFLYKRTKGLHLGRKCCFLRPSISMERCLPGKGVKEHSRRRRAEIPVSNCTMVHR